MTENNNTDLATFAGGCFWCTTKAFDGITGVVSAISGYIGGHGADPTYEQVCSGTTGHFEATQVRFRPDKISYAQLVALYFKQINPADDGGAFADRGSQYRSAIFFHDTDQEETARRIIRAIDASDLFDRPVATLLLPATAFYPAETYHQDYHKKNATRYQFYRISSGRDLFMEQHQKEWEALFAELDIK